MRAVNKLRDRIFLNHKLITCHHFNKKKATKSSKEIDTKRNAEIKSIKSTTTHQIRDN